jgi:hypothetical protein
MGLFKKMIEKAQANLPDHAAEVGKCLPAGDTVTASGFGMHRAYDGATGGRGIDGIIVNKVIAKASAHGHISGDVDSCARAIPSDMQGMHHIAITSQGLSFWDFGMTNRELPPRELVSFPRSSVRSIAKTGKAPRGYEDVRITFTDDSYVDYGVMQGQDDFLRALVAIQ